ncbi:hypothetical protein [Candidatus Albibeggiatoa sp. nov. NOAA]|uniref:hypothetical protein n=1 Tax=Candidatus Albibeggiatoa sp. nov. NOAA TaxID=3162724 RepID=UPI0032F3B893|nr:hypothetical protein [Thiotrichaceae bacterium]
MSDGNTVINNITNNIIQGNVSNSNINTGDNVNQSAESNVPTAVQEAHAQPRHSADTSEEDLLKKSLLLARLDRKDHFKQFDKAFESYKSTEYRKDAATKSNTCFYQKPLVFILHGDESAQLDMIARRIRFYDVRRLVNDENLRTLCEIPKDVEIKYYPLHFGRFFYDSENLTEELSNVVLFNAAKSIGDVTKQLAREKTPILIELNISAEHLESINSQQRESAILEFINYWANLEKVKQTSPLFIILTFKYQANSFFFIEPASNKVIRNTLNQIENNCTLNNVIVLPKFDKLTKLEVAEWIKDYFSVCQINHMVNDDMMEKAFKFSKSLTMKQAVAKFEQLLAEHC